MLVSSSVDSGFFSMDDRHTAGKTSDLGMGGAGEGVECTPKVETRN